MVINWLRGMSAPWAATSASSGRSTLLLMSSTIDDVATIADVYSAGLPCMPARLMR